ncbi:MULTISPECIES: SHOCT domain-containing protein [Kitasatospora]|uniref:SHOCT domain-containing protein n=1 Tax=Kitasatospora arboriphila TaxID=258052 RepID=A0ABP4E682_9ACTN
MTYWNGHGMNGWGFGFMTVGMVLFWALLVLGIVVLVRHLGRTGPPPPGPPAPPPADPGRPRTDPEQLLAERFARGEIDAEEYRHRLETLRTAGRPGSG